MGKKNWVGEPCSACLLIIASGERLARPISCNHMCHVSCLVQIDANHKPGYSRAENGILLRNTDGNPILTKPTCAQCRKEIEGIFFQDRNDPGFVGYISISSSNNGDSIEVIEISGNNFCAFYIRRYAVAYNG